MSIKILCESLRDAIIFSSSAKHNEFCENLIKIRSLEEKLNFEHGFSPLLLSNTSEKSESFYCKFNDLQIYLLQISLTDYRLVQKRSDSSSELNWLGVLSQGLNLSVIEKKKKSRTCFNQSFIDNRHVSTK